MAVAKFNFRATQAFVTDGDGETYVLREDVYPTTRDGHTFGWVTTAPGDSRDRNSGIDPRLAGMHFTNNGGSAQRTFRYDCGPGAKAIDLGGGDAGDTQQFGYYEFYDGEDFIAVVSGTASQPGRFWDARGTRHDSAALWVANRQTLPVMLAADYVTIKIGTDAVAQFGNTSLAHFGVEDTNSNPVVTPLSPSEGATVRRGVPFTVNGTAADTEDGDLTSDITVSSDIEGDLGVTGLPATVTLTVPGPHVLSLSVTDSADATDTATINVMVTTGLPTVRRAHALGLM